MSKVNLQVNLIAYDDIKVSNNPAIRPFDLLYKQSGLDASEPISQSKVIAPSTEMVIFDGIRTTSIDGSSAFTSTRPDINKNVYRFTNVAGTAPIFRTSRAIGADLTTVFTITVNGPIMTLTNSSGTAPNFTSVQVGDILNILPGSGPSSSNQGRFTILAKTSNSLSVNNILTSAQTFTILDTSAFLVYSNGASGNQIQIGDKAIISAGFSSSVFGTYEILEVTPSWFEISIGYPNGIPLESSKIPTASGLIFYSSAKKMLLVAAQQRCSLKINGATGDNLELIPSELDNPEKPALFITQGVVYSLSINNLSIESLQILIASVE
jgi:hypothetical protein